MKLRIPDLAIIAAYLVTMVVIGWTLRKKARLNKENYLMGGKSLPWYMLGLSDASDMFDISGTMWMVSLCFVYGMKSIVLKMGQIEDVLRAICSHGEAFT